MEKGKSKKEKGEQFFLKQILEILQHLVEVVDALLVNTSLLGWGSGK